MEILAILIAYLLSKGHGAVDFADPPPGTVIVDFEGTLENAITITCNITHTGIQVGTSWSIENFFRNIPGLQSLTNQDFQEIPELTIDGDLRPSGLSTYQNRLTIVVLSSQLDGAIIYCGTGQQPRQASYPVRVYRPPNLQDNLRLSILENTVSVPVELRKTPVAFPEPTVYTWSKDGQAFNHPSLTYSRVTFAPLRRTDAGNYMVSVTNYILGSNSEQVGNDTGSFFLNVIYGPSFREPGSVQQYALLGESLSLICGTGLDSNPQATITWTAPDTTTIAMNTGRYTLDNGPDVRLNFSQTIMSDAGIWVCDVRVMSVQTAVSNGSLIEVDSTVIGAPIIRNIQLIIIGPSSQPLTLSVDTIGATYFRVCWEEPRDILSPISYYLININYLNSTDDLRVDDAFIRNTTTDVRVFNITGLLPGTTYGLTVVAVSQGGDVVATSEPSDPVVHTTGFTVPAPTCNAPLSSNGVITVSWSYIHTGGLPLTNLSVVYRYEEGLATSPLTPIDIASVEVMRAMVSNLVAGRLYTFTISTENTIGFISIDCGPIRLNTGIPAEPSFGELSSGPDSGQVSIQIKTTASGLGELDNDAQGFEFVLVPVLNGVPGNELRFPRPNYQSNTFETITIGDLIPRQSYTFIATAVNFFGISAPANSTLVLAGSSNSGSAIIGVVLGVILLVIIVVAVMITVITTCTLYVKGKKIYNIKTEVPVYDEPDNFRQSTTNTSDIELKDCPAYEKVQKDTHIELEQCPAYGELALK